MSEDKKEPKIEVKVSINIAVLWTMGWLYTMGALISQPSNIEFIANLPRWQAILVGIGIYAVWPAILGYAQWVGKS